MRVKRLGSNYDLADLTEWDIFVLARALNNHGTEGALALLEVLENSTDFSEDLTELLKELPTKEDVKTHYLEPGD